MCSPEELARQQIDALLQKCGWTIQDYKKLDLFAGRGIAIREVRLKKGRCDYLLLIDRKPVGIIEAKKAGVTLSSVADQSGQYAENFPDFLRGNLTGHRRDRYSASTPCRADANCGGSGAAFECGGGVGVGCIGQSSAGGPSPPVNPPGGILPNLQRHPLGKNSA